MTSATVAVRIGRVGPTVAATIVTVLFVDPIDGTLSADLSRGQQMLAHQLTQDTLMRQH